MSSDEQTEGMKKCSVCNEVKPLDDFYKTDKKAFGRSYMCKKCTSDYNKKFRKRALASLNDDDKRHGTFYAYTLGCRCDKCRDAAKFYMRDYRRKKRASEN